MMGFSIKLGEHYVKRTARFGPYYGEIYVTDDPKEKRVWTRHSDAVKAATFIAQRLFPSRRDRYERDKKVPRCVPQVISEDD